MSVVSELLEIFREIMEYLMNIVELISDIGVRLGYVKE